MKSLINHILWFTGIVVTSIAISFAVVSLAHADINEAYYDPSQTDYTMPVMPHLFIGDDGTACSGLADEVKYQFVGSVAGLNETSVNPSGAFNDFDTSAYSWEFFTEGEEVHIEAVFYDDSVQCQVQDLSSAFPETVFTWHATPVEELPEATSTIDQLHDDVYHGHILFIIMMLIPMWYFKKK